MTKLKRTASFFLSLLLCGSTLGGVACGKDGGNTDSSSSEYVPPAPSVFKLEEHTWDAWETVTEKTCSRDGQEKLVCTDKDCGAVKTRTVKAGHVFGDWTGSMDEICTKDATLSRTCLDCGHTERQTVAKRAHAYENGVCKICETPFVFPTLKENPSFVDVWGDTVRGSGGAFDRKALKTNTYYTMEMPVTDKEQEDYGVWVSVPVNAPGQYALLTIGSANGVAIDRFDAEGQYINPNSHTATQHENGAIYSIVNCGEKYWHENWRATWRFTTDTATTVKFVVVRIADEEWTPKSLHETAIPQQINNVTADEPPAGYTSLAVDYNAEYYFDEWNGVYRLGTKENPGEVIYMAVNTAATRLFGDQTFVTIQENTNNLSFFIGEDSQGNYLIRDYDSFLLANVSTDGNAYENFVNSRGMYPVTQELYEFLQLYTQKNKPIDIPDSIWENEEEYAKKAWLAPCYCYREIAPGTKDNPYVIDQLGDFEASLKRFDIVYFRVKYTDESGNPATTLTLSCDNENAVVNVNGTSYRGPFSIDLEVTAMGVVVQVSAADFAASTFTLNLSVTQSSGN